MDKPISRQLIKPISPTPQHLRYSKFSILDQLAPRFHAKFMFCFRASTTVDGNQQTNKNSNMASRSEQLKQSLSQILVKFYSLAGRIEGNNHIVCNDEGVPYYEANAKDHRLDDIMDRRDIKSFRNFFPSEDLCLREIPLIVQTTFLGCGGIIIAFLHSHKVADATTASFFFNSWGAASRKDDLSTVSPDFDTALRIFPPIHQAPIKEAPMDNVANGNLVAKAFIFNDSIISSLKAKAKSEKVPRLTRTQVVTALIWKCATANAEKTSVFTSAINLRDRLVPPLPDNTMGNLAGDYIVTKSANDRDFPALVALISKGLSDFKEKCTANLSWDDASASIQEATKEFGDLFETSDIDLYTSSSLCGLKLWDVDFGWGKPQWMGPSIMEYKNSIMLFESTVGRGIEAWVCLEEKHMRVFEQELHLQPSILGLDSAILCFKVDST